MHVRRWATFGVGVLLMTWGCSSKAPTAPGTKTSASSTAVELRLLVVDDPSMAVAIRGLASEWKAQGGGSLTVEEATTALDDDAFVLDSMIDAMIYPSRLLGPLAHREALAPLPDNYYDSRALAWSDTFDLLQLAETRWGPQPYAVPFGSPVLMCFCRADLLERLRRKPPSTWSEYQELAQLLARQSASDGDTGRFAVAEPLAKGWAGRTLLGRAAAYAKHRGHYSTLFNVESMEPLITGPAFARALEELVAAAKLGPEDALEMDVDDTREAFLAGKCGMVLTWPGRREPGASADAKGVPLSIVELPGSPKVYDYSSKLWEEREGTDHRVTLLGLAGRLGSVTRQSTHSEASFQLLAWLAGTEWGANVSSASAATTLYRRSQVRDPRPWLDPQIDAQQAERYALAVRDAMTRDSYLFALRIPGQEKYLVALDNAVRSAVRGEATPAAALAVAADEWRKTTQELGLDAQRKAYRQSLGLEP